MYCGGHLRADTLGVSKSAAHWSVCLYVEPDPRATTAKKSLGKGMGRKPFYATPAGQNLNTVDAFIVGGNGERCWLTENPARLDPGEGG